MLIKTNYLNKKLESVYLTDIKLKVEQQFYICMLRLMLEKARENGRVHVTKRPRLHFYKKRVACEKPPQI